jgi:hypothetical protein
MNPLNPKHRARLFRAIAWSRKQLEPFRAMRKTLIQNYVGSNYNKSTSGGSERIVNMMRMTADVYTLALTANRPRFLVSTQYSELGSFARVYQQALNNYVEEMKLEWVFAQCALDAFFTMGIAKTYLADSALVELEEGVWVDPGRPYVGPISMDNWVHDTNSPHWNRRKFAGDVYRISYDKVMQDKEIFDKKAKMGLQPNSKFPNAIGGTTPVSELTSGEDSDPDEYEPMIDLVDIEVPDEGLVITWACDHGIDDIKNTDPLIVREWDGPEAGPYERLSYADVPDNIMPATPGQDLKALDDLLNSLMRKHSMEARARKDIPIFQGGAEDDVSRIRSASHLDFTRVQDPNSIGLLKFAGVDPATYAFTMGVQDVFSRMAGNLDAMAGLGPQSETATQDQIIMSQVSKREAKMQYRMADFAGRVGRSVGNILWKDELSEQDVELKVEGLEKPIRVPWTPEDREGDFLEYNFSIEPFSMAYQSPSQRIGQITGLMQQIFLPMHQSGMLQEAGGSIDIQEFTETIAELLNLPRLKDIVNFSQPLLNPRPEPTSESGPRQAPTTTRINIRKNIPTSGTDQSRRHTMMAAAFGQGGGVNGDQLAALSR